MATWTDYNKEIDKMRDILNGRTLLDFVSDLEEAMTKRGITDISERYAIARGFNKVFRESDADESRDIVELCESVFQGVIGWECGEATVASIFGKMKEEGESDD